MFNRSHSLTLSTTNSLTISDPNSQSSIGPLLGAAGASSSLQPGQHFYTYGADVLMDFVLYSPSIQDHFADAYPVEEQSHDHESPRGLQGREGPSQPGPSQTSSQPQASTSSNQDNETPTASRTQLRRLETMRQLPPSSHSPLEENYATASPPWSPASAKPTDFATHKRKISDLTGVRGREYPLDRDYDDKLQDELRKIEEGKEDELAEGAESGKRRSKRVRKGTKRSMSSSTWTKKERKDSNDKGHPASGNGVEQPAGAV
jgi:hypothetical protein